MSDSAVLELTIPVARRTVTRDDRPRPDFLSFGALLAEVLQERRDDPECLGYDRGPGIDHMRPRSAA